MKLATQRTCRYLTYMLDRPGFPVQRPRIPERRTAGAEEPLGAVSVTSPVVEGSVRVTTDEPPWYVFSYLQCSTYSAASKCGCPERVKVRHAVVRVIQLLGNKYTATGTQRNPP